MYLDHLQEGEGGSLGDVHDNVPQPQLHLSRLPDLEFTQKSFWKLGQHRRGIFLSRLKKRKENTKLFFFFFRLLKRLMAYVTSVTKSVTHGGFRVSIHPSWIVRNLKKCDYKGSIFFMRVCTTLHQGAWPRIWLRVT